MIDQGAAGGAKPLRVPDHIPAEELPMDHSCARLLPVLLLFQAGCPQQQGTADAGMATLDAASTPDAGRGGLDGGTAALDGARGDAAVVMDGGLDAGVTDAAGSGVECTFNVDCPPPERCECDETTGCHCRSGIRGSGQSGVDVCTTGDDCDTALCVEGQGGAFYCSGPCGADAGCGSALPVCANITFLGRVCIR